MVDTEKRKTAVELIRKFVNGQITNDEYDNSYPDNTQDNGLLVIYDRLWFFYSDLRTHRLGEDDLANEERELIKRCIEFLRSNLEYEGPLLRERKPISGLGDFFRRLFPREKPYSVLSEQSRKDSAFETPWWPFSNEEQFRQHSSAAQST